MATVAHRIGDEIGEYFERRKVELSRLVSQQHSKAMIFTSTIVCVLHAISMVSEFMIEGQLNCIKESSSCPLINYTDAMKEVNIGLWNGEVLGISVALCSDWPDPDKHAALCDSVKTARTFVFLAIIFAVGAVVGSVMRMLEEKETLPFKVVLALALSGVSGMIAYSVWQGNCSSELNDLVYGIVDSRGLANVHYWNSLGYSYSCMLFAWIFSLGFLVSKLALPGLTTIENNIQRDSIDATRKASVSI